MEIDEQYDSTTLEELAEGIHEFMSFRAAHVLTVPYLSPRASREQSSIRRPFL